MEVGQRLRRQVGELERGERDRGMVGHNIRPRLQDRDDRIGRKGSRREHRPRGREIDQHGGFRATRDQRADAIRHAEVRQQAGRIGDALVVDADTVEDVLAADLTDDGVAAAIRLEHHAVGRREPGDVDGVAAVRAFDADGVEVQAGLVEVADHDHRVADIAGVGNGVRVDLDLLDIVELRDDRRVVRAVARDHDLGVGGDVGDAGRDRLNAGIDAEGFDVGIAGEDVGVGSAAAINDVATRFVGALVDEVIPVATEDRVIAEAADKDVASVAAEERVGAAETEDRPAILPVRPDH